MRKFLISVLLAAALIFAGGLNSAAAATVTWSNWSWGSQVPNVNADPVSWTPSAWGGLYLHTDTAISSGNTFKFTISNVPANEKIRVYFYDQNNNQLPQLGEITTSGSYSYPVNTAIKGFLLQEGTGRNQPAMAVGDITLAAPAVNTNWADWSWNGQASLGTPVTFKSFGQWSGLYLHTDTAINVSNFIFSAKVAQAGQKFQIIFYDENNNPLGAAKSLNITTSLTSFSVPVNHTIKGVVFQDAGPVQDLLTVDMSNNLPAPLPLPVVIPAAGGGIYTTSGSSILKNGSKINLHGINWFGFETDTHVVHGLWTRGYKDVISQIKSLGFNAVRLPYCPSSVAGVATTSIDYSKNSDLNGLNSLQVLDKIVNEMSSQGIFVLLDSHRPDCNAQSELWYTGSYSESAWTADLVNLAKRYANVPNFIGLDLKNEPHGSATWGTGNVSTDWNLAAEKAGNAVLAANPNILVFVEGVGDNPTCQDNNGHFWGGNLAPVKCKTLNLPANKYVYSPHVYGPDVAYQSYFDASNFPNNMPAIWDAQWGFLSGTNAVAVGEWGGKNDFTWQNALAGYMVSKGLCSSFYWDLNPNSGDTGGILTDDWVTPVSAKVSLLQNYFTSCK